MNYEFVFEAMPPVLKFSVKASKDKLDAIL